jgi:hypothetical protein
VHPFEPSLIFKRQEPSTKTRAINLCDKTRVAMKERKERKKSQPRNTRTTRTILLLPVRRGEGEAELPDLISFAAALLYFPFDYGIEQ